MKFQWASFSKIVLILGIILGCSIFLEVGETKAEDYSKASVTSEVYGDGSFDITGLFEMASSTVIITSSTTIGDGTYQLGSGFSGRVTIANTAENVKIIGSGSRNLYTDIIVQGSRTGALILTIEDLDILGTAAHGIDFANADNFDNKLYISGENTVVGYSNGTGILVPDGVTLTIDKAEGVDYGKLTARGGGAGAGIGGYQGSAGNITINGGIIRAEAGSSGGAGIGGGNGGSGGNITINGGTVTAMGYQLSSGYKLGEGAGIGGGKGANGGTITIEGGIVNAEGAPGSAGIGASRRGTNGQITIRGGEIQAAGGAGRTTAGGHGGGAGIGGGGGSNDMPGSFGGSIIIEGGTVISTGGDGLTSSSFPYYGGAGIGGGGGNSSYTSTSLDGTVTISGGSVSATGKSGGAGIGGGNGRPGCIVEITGGTVTATGGAAPATWDSGGAGIGGGNGSRGGNVVIHGGTVTATGGSGSFGGGAGIGGAGVQDGGNISISGGIVTAAGGFASAGIGGGGNAFAGGSGGTISISGGIVKSTGGNTAAGIGGGGGVYGAGSGGIITISGGAITAVGKEAAGIGGGCSSSSNNSGSGGTITIINHPTVVATGSWNGDDIGNAKTGVGTTVLKDAFNNDLSYIRLAVTYGSAKKSNVTVTMDEINYITDQDGLTGLFIHRNSTPTIGIKAPDLNVDAEMTIAASQSQSRRETIELSYYRADLNNLLLSSGILDPAFSSDKATYTASVGYGTSSVTVRPSAEAPYSIKVNGTVVANGTNSSPIPLEVGSNEVEIVVTAGDGVTKKTYMIYIVRRPQITLTVSGSFTAENKEYDGNTGAVIDSNNLILLGIVGDDDVALSAVLAFEDPHVGEEKNVGLSEACSLTGAQAGNYALSLIGAPTAKGEITPKEITVINAAAQDKVYDGTTHAEIAGAELSGVIEGEDVVLSNHTAGAFTQSGVGTDISVLTDMVITGDDISNYTLVQPTLTANITVKELTVINAAAQDKVYDGTTSAEITGAELNGVIEGEDVVLMNHTAGAFTQAGVGTDISVLTDMVITGDDISNYALVSPTLTANITVKELTVINAAAQDKIYDGTTDAVITGAHLEGVVGSDDVELDVLVGTFTVKTVGIDIEVIPGLTLKGIDKDNYRLQQPIGLKAKIEPKELTVINAAAQDKVYDGTSDAEISNAELSGVIEGDDVLLADHTSGTFAQDDAAQANVGTGISVRTEMTVSGRDADNYYLVQPEGLKANILVRPLTIKADTLRKTYGDIDPELTYQITKGQLVGSDSMTGELIRDIGENADSYAIQQGSLTAGTNYHITFEGAQLIIERKVLTITAEDKSKVYGAVDPTFSVVYDGFITGEDENDLSGTLLFSREEGEEAGRYTITPSALTSANYLIMFVDGTLTILSNNADLSNLALSNLTLGDLTLSPVFDPEITNYTAKVRNSVSRVILTPVLDDCNAAITVNTIPVASGEASGAISLGVGANIIIVVVTAEDGETAKTYTITINRAHPSLGGGHTPTPSQPELESETNDGGEEPEISHPKTKVISLVFGEPVTTVDGIPHILDAAPFFKPGVNRTLVPVRFVSEMLGARVQWQAETQQVLIAYNDTEIVLTIGSDKALINGNTIILDCPAEIVPPGRAFVPLRFVSETLGAEVQWDAAAKIITIIQTQAVK